MTAVDLFNERNNMLILKKPFAGCLKNVLFVILVLSIWAMFHAYNLIILKPSFSPDSHYEVTSSPDQEILNMIPQHLRKYVTLCQENFTSDCIGTLQPKKTQLNVTQIKEKIENNNKLQAIRNENKFGKLGERSLVIVIQVHRRLIYLRYLIVSLAQAEGIESALLIFSHDYYDEEINELIRSIDFCKVTQIFYPYSIQTHEYTFPGESPDDCPRDVNIEEAIELKCANALSPDRYGHYREAKFTQTKHHWWWKANMVFDSLNVTKKHDGLFLFVEEDHYLAKDFIHTLHLMEDVKQNVCKACDILSLGTYIKQDFTFGDERDFAKAEIVPWMSSRLNMGMAFKRVLWNKFKACASTFCLYDDYNWDYSLQAVANTCLANKLEAFAMTVPRIFHVGECGIHHSKSCNDLSAVKRTQQLLFQMDKYLFTNMLSVRRIRVLKKKLTKNGYGGWGDRRDQQLCLSMVREA